MSKVAVIMGSLSDLPIMQEAIDILKGFDIEVELNHFVKKNGFSIIEIPIDYRTRIGKKKLGIRHGFIILKRIILDIF